MTRLSKIYNKSISEKFRKYFISVDELTNSFVSFSPEKDSFLKRDHALPRSWDTGYGGIPLTWDRQKGTISVDQTDSHSLVISPTGSRKSRLIMMPLVRILGSAGESMIISDPKAEIYNRTAAYLQQREYNIFVLNLRSPMHGQRWNPLAIPFDFYSRGEIDKSYEFVNDIAENLIQAEKSNSEPFWDNSAGSLFFGLVLLLFKYCKDFHLTSDYVHIGNVIGMRNALLSGAGGEKNPQLWNYAKTDPIIASSLIGTVETAHDTKAGILSTFDQKVRMFSIQPNLLDMLGNSDIEMQIIGRKPTAVFLIVPDEKTGYHGLVSLFIKQSYEYMIFDALNQTQQDGLHVGALYNRVNYVLDEFSSLPTIHDFPAMITAARSRNIRFTLAIQSKHQLIQRYKEETDTIQTNCNNWIFLTGRELQLLEEISSLCGETLEDNPKPVLSVSDLQRMDKERGEALLLCGRAKPCITCLADIDVYDGNQFAQKTVEMRTPQPPPRLKIETVKIGEKAISEFLANPFISPPDIDQNINFKIDQAIKEIDMELERLAELEKEEKSEENKSVKNKEDIKEQDGNERDEL